MRRYLPSQKWRDLGIMAVILLLMWIPAAEYEAFEWLHSFMNCSNMKIHFTLCSEMLVTNFLSKL